MEHKEGLLLVVTDDMALVSTLADLDVRGMNVRIWCPQNDNSQLQSDLLDTCQCIGRRRLIVKGDIHKSSFYTQWQKFGPICVVLSMNHADEHRRTRDDIVEYLPSCKILSIRSGRPDTLPRKLSHERELVLSWAELLARPFNAEIRHLQATHNLAALRGVLNGAEKIALLLQPDPDPDGIACALALRSLIGRNKSSTPIVSFGHVTRPENKAMLRLLDIDVEVIKPDALADFDKVVLLDTQPTHFGFNLAKIDVVIDHHPVTAQYHVPFKDVRPHYGATSSILTEYLRAAAVPLTERLATALLYGIKTDTMSLNREVIDADLDAFVTLYPHINYNLLRRIEKPELPASFAPKLAQALCEFKTQSGIMVTCLGEVEREDLIPQIADFLLQFEDTHWAICAGVFEENVIMSVRNVGYVKNAGDVIKKILSGWGLGGGHRTMGKIIVQKSVWLERFGSITAHDIRDKALELFMREAL